MFGPQPASTLNAVPQPQQPLSVFGSTALGINTQQPQLQPFAGFQQQQQPPLQGGGLFVGTPAGLGVASQFPANTAQPAAGPSLFAALGAQQPAFAPAPQFGQPQQLATAFAQPQQPQMLGPNTFGGVNVQQPFPAPVAPAFGFDASSFNWNNVASSPQEMMQRLDQMQQALRRQELARQMSSILSYRNPYGDEVSTVLAELEAQRARDRAAASGLSTTESVGDSDLTRLIISQMRRDFNRPTSALEHMRVLRGDLAGRLPSTARHASVSTYARVGPLNLPRGRPLSDARPDDLDVSYANSSFGGLSGRAAGLEEERDWNAPRSTLRSTRPGNKSIDWEKRKARNLSANASSRSEQPSSLYPSVRDEHAESSLLAERRRQHHSFTEGGDTWAFAPAPARQRVRPNLVDAAAGDDEPAAETSAAAAAFSVAPRSSFEGHRSPPRERLLERERSVDRSTDSPDELENTGSTPTASSPLPAVIVKGEPREVESTRSPAAAATFSALSADSARSASGVGGDLFSEEVQAMTRDLAALSHHRARIMCSRPDYSTTPSLEELEDMVDDEGNCYVENFTITRVGYGQVRFLQPVNVVGLNLDKIGICYL